MILGIDAREIENGVTTGIGRALANFLEYFNGLTDENRCILFSSKPLEINYGSRIKNIVYRPTITIIWDQIILTIGIRKHGVNIFFSTYYKIPLFAPVPCISTIFDLMYLTFEPYKRRLSLFEKAYYYT
ncbi:MAG: hypothetical protein PHC61_10250, partial [Chitinivibrionales bacterium]|nr:hypothetical protein [Chitinivibrionales bacterium]